jgi:hypothetical protein
MPRLLVASFLASIIDPVARAINFWRGKPRSDAHSNNPYRDLRWAEKDEIERMAFRDVARRFAIFVFASTAITIVLMWGAK